MMKRYNDSVKELAKQFKECSKEFNQYVNYYDVLWKDKTLYLSWLPYEIYESILNNLYLFDYSKIYSITKKLNKFMLKIDAIEDNKYDIIIEANGEYGGLYGTFGYFINYDMVYKYMKILDERLKEDYEMSFREIKYVTLYEQVRTSIKTFGCYIFNFSGTNINIHEWELKND